jgi:hypothetical protein
MLAMPPDAIDHVIVPKSLVAFASASAAETLTEIVGRPMYARALEGGTSSVGARPGVTVIAPLTSLGP